MSYYYEGSSSRELALLSLTRHIGALCSVAFHATAVELGILIDGLHSVTIPLSETELYNADLTLVKIWPIWS